MDDMDDSSEMSDLGDMDNEIVVGNNVEHITIENVALLAVECIRYVMEWNNLRWIPPVDPDNLRRHARYEYFTSEIGKALVHHCMISEILVLGAMTRFSVKTWLRLTVEEARIYVDEHFHEFLFILPSTDADNFVNLYLWAFASYLCVRAVKSNRSNFISHVLSKLINIMYARSSISMPYYYINVLATLYNRCHAEMHSVSDDEGYRTNVDGIADGIDRFRD